VSHVHVVTNLDMGWDNVVGVFISEESALRYCFPDETEKSLDELRDFYEENSYYLVIHTKRLMA
jgi:hypothetical protein